MDAGQGTRGPRGVEFDPASGERTFREAAQAWIDSRHDLKAGAAAGYRYALAPVSKRRGDGKTLGIDAVFGDYPLNRITREQISTWVQRMQAAGKKPSTVRHAFWTVRMVLARAVADGRIPANPAEYVRLPGEHGDPGVVDDPAQFLTAEQVASLVTATPWPYDVLVHLAAWSGLRAAELGGLQVRDIGLPAPSINPNASAKPGMLRVEHTAHTLGTETGYLPPKTKGSRRRVPLSASTTALLRDYLAVHPRRDEPTAPLFPAMRLKTPRPTGKRADNPAPTANAKARRQADALAALSVDEAADRLVLDWYGLLRQQNFYKAVYRPAVLRANRLTPTAALSPDLKFHSLRHTYISLCVAAGITPLEISRFAGHAKVTTTLGIYNHLFATDDHASAMVALDAMSQPRAQNVVPMRRRG